MKWTERKGTIRGKEQKRFGGFIQHYADGATSLWHWITVARQDGRLIRKSSHCYKRINKLTGKSAAISQEIKRGTSITLSCGKSDNLGVGP